MQINPFDAYRIIKENDDIETWNNMSRSDQLAAKARTTSKYHDARFRVREIEKEVDHEVKNVKNDVEQNAKKVERRSIKNIAKGIANSKHVAAALEAGSVLAIDSLVGEGTGDATLALSKLAANKIITSWNKGDDNVKQDIAKVVEDKDKIKRDVSTILKDSAKGSVDFVKESIKELGHEYKEVVSGARLLYKHRGKISDMEPEEQVQAKQFLRVSMITAGALLLGHAELAEASTLTETAMNAGTIIVGAMLKGPLIASIATVGVSKLKHLFMKEDTNEDEDAAIFQTFFESISEEMEKQPVNKAALLEALASFYKIDLPKEDDLEESKQIRFSDFLNSINQ